MGKFRNAIQWWNVRRRYENDRKMWSSSLKYLLDSESKRVMKLRGKYISHPDIVSFLKGFAKDDIEFEIPELAGKKI